MATLIIQQQQYTFTDTESKINNSATEMIEATENYQRTKKMHTAGERRRRRRKNKQVVCKPKYRIVCNLDCEYLLNAETNRNSEPEKKVKPKRRKQKKKMGHSC